MTIIVKEFDDTILRQIVKILDNKGVVAFPTETVYALAADAFSDEAVDKIYRIKGRSNCKPLSVLVGEIYQAKRIVHFDQRALDLAVRFFPGPLTLILNTKEHNNLSSHINKDLGTVGIRMPNHILSLKILKAVGRPLIGTSANISGNNPACNAEQVLKEIGGKVDMIIDQGITEFGIGSTIVDLSKDKVSILREGVISAEEIMELLG